ncbi:acyltransferase family protein [Pseudarthrobacter sp. CCNWLW207]|uniref:acyltransferase family protein n=1 Tax=Pseudarthrobacter sp. CCNWLW207 TaxID=3127468 RepID=UPI0030777715
MTQRLGEFGTDTSTRRSSARFKHIDALRALAVLLVAVSHAGLGTIVPGGAGVTIFFTISGFIITHILIRERMRTGSFDPRQFYIKRILKLAPPLFVVIVIPTFVYSFFARIDWYAFLGQIFFFYNWVRISADGAVLPGSGVTWSLAIEEQFYIGFSIFWIFASRLNAYMRTLQVLAVAAIGWALVTRFVLAAAGASEYRVEFGTDSRLDSIALGILSATIYASVSERVGKVSVFGALTTFAAKSWVFVSAVLLFLVATAIPNEFFKDTLRYFLQSLAIALILIYGMQRPRDILSRIYSGFCEMRFLQIIGLSSYSIYLVHVPLYHLIDWVDLGIDGPILISLKLVISVVLGSLVWRILEVPIERYKTRLFSRGRPLG